MYLYKNLSNFKEKKASWWMRILPCILLAHLFYWSYLFIFIVFFAKWEAPGFKEHLANLTASEHIISWSDEGIVWD